MPADQSSNPNVVYKNGQWVYKAPETALSGADRNRATATASNLNYLAAQYAQKAPSKPMTYRGFTWADQQWNPTAVQQQAAAPAATTAPAAAAVTTAPAAAPLAAAPPAAVTTTPAAVTTAPAATAEEVIRSQQAAIAPAVTAAPGFDPSKWRRDERGRYIGPTNATLTYDQYSQISGGAAPTGAAPVRAVEQPSVPPTFSGNVGEWSRYIDPNKEYTYVEYDERGQPRNAEERFPGNVLLQTFGALDANFRSQLMAMLEKTGQVTSGSYFDSPEASTIAQQYAQRDEGLQEAWEAEQRAKGVDPSQVGLYTRDWLLARFQTATTATTAPAADVAATAPAADVPLRDTTQYDVDASELTAEDWARAKQSLGIGPSQTAFAPLQLEALRVEALRLRQQPAADVAATDPVADVSAADPEAIIRDQAGGVEISTAPGATADAPYGYAVAADQKTLRPRTKEEWDRKQELEAATTVAPVQDPAAVSWSSLTEEQRRDPEGFRATPVTFGEAYDKNDMSIVSAQDEEGNSLVAFRNSPGGPITIAKKGSIDDMMPSFNQTGVGQMEWVEWNTLSDEQKQSARDGMDQYSGIVGEIRGIGKSEAVGLSPDEGGDVLAGPEADAATQAEADELRATVAGQVEDTLTPQGVARKAAIAKLEAGQMPTAAELSAAGMTAADVHKYTGPGAGQAGQAEQQVTVSGQPIDTRPIEEQRADLPQVDVEEMIAGAGQAGDLTEEQRSQGEAITDSLRAEGLAEGEPLSAEDIIRDDQQGVATEPVTSAEDLIRDDQQGVATEPVAGVTGATEPVAGAWHDVRVGSVTPLTPEQEEEVREAARQKIRDMTPEDAKRVISNLLGTAEREHGPQYRLDLERRLFERNKARSRDNSLSVGSRQQASKDMWAAKAAIDAILNDDENGTALSKWQRRADKAIGAKGLHLSLARYYSELGHSFPGVISQLEEELAELRLIRDIVPSREPAAAEAPAVSEAAAPLRQVEGGPLPITSRNGVDLSDNNVFIDLTKYKNSLATQIQHLKYRLNTFDRWDRDQGGNPLPTTIEFRSAFIQRGAPLSGFGRGEGGYDGPLSVSGPEGARQAISLLEEALGKANGRHGHWMTHGKAPDTAPSATYEDKVAAGVGFDWPPGMPEAQRKSFSEGEMEDGASYHDPGQMNVSEAGMWIYSKSANKWVKAPDKPYVYLTSQGGMNLHTRGKGGGWYGQLSATEKTTYADLRKLYFAHGKKGENKFGHMTKSEMLALSGNDVFSPIDVYKHNRWLQNNTLNGAQEASPGEQLVEDLAEDTSKPVDEPDVVEGGPVDVVGEGGDEGSSMPVVDPVVDPAVDPFVDPVVDPVVADPVVDQQPVDYPNLIAENIIRGDQQVDQGQVDQVDQGQVDQGVVDQGQVDQGQVDQGVVEDVIRDDQQVDQGVIDQGQVDQGVVDQQVPDRLVEDANGERFVVKADGTTYNMNNEVVDPVQGTDIATWDPTQGWMSAHRRDDDEEPTFAENMGLENAIEVSTPLSWDEVTRPRIDPGWAQRRVNVEYEQARQSIEQARRDQAWAGRGMGTGLGTEYAHMVDPFVQSMTGARTAEAMIPYQTAIENEAWRRGLSEQQFNQMLGLAGVTAEDWYSRAFRAQEFQRISDALMQQLASPLLGSLLGSVFSGPQGMAMMESVMPGVQTALGQSYTPATQSGYRVYT